MRRKAALTITLAVLSLFAFSRSSSQNVCGASYSVNQALATSISQWNQQNITTLQWQGVDWVISYDTIVNSSLVATAHSLGLKVMVYVTSLKEHASAKNGIFNGYTTVYPQQSWAQVANDSSKTVMYPDPLGGELWFSPYGPYPGNVTIPRIWKNLQLGADGIFLDTLILYGDASGRYADNSTYANRVWKTSYLTKSYQEFRYQSLHDNAKRIYDSMHNATSPNPNAVLVISDNNVCVQSVATEIQLRAKFASAIDRWQDGADAFVLEYVSLIENNNPSNPVGEAQNIINVWSREKSTYGVNKPMWLIGYTNRIDVFNFMTGQSASQGFGYWTYNLYLASTLAQNPLGRTFFIFSHKKYYITNPAAFTSYGLNWGDVKPYTVLNPDDYPSSQIHYDYLLDGKLPLPNRPYIAGDVNDGSLYWIPYYTWTGEKYPISLAGLNGYGGQLKTLQIRYGDPAVSLPTSSYILDGTNPIPTATPPSFAIGRNPLGRIFFIFNNLKYYFTDWNAYTGYGFKSADINLSVNPDSYLSAQVSFDYILEDMTSVLRKPLPNQPYIAGDVNDGGLYWIPYYTWTGEKYPITGAGYNGYSGQLKTLQIRYGDPAMSLPTSSYVLDGINPIPQAVG